MKHPKQPTEQPAKRYVKVDSKTTILVDRAIGDEEAKQKYLEKLNASELFVKKTGGFTAKRRMSNKPGQEEPEEQDLDNETLESVEIPDDVIDDDE